MQKNIFLAIALCGCGFGIKAQRDNGKVRYISNKTEDLDTLQSIKDTRDEKVAVEVTKDAISILPINKPGEAMSGNLTDISCLWKDAFTNGKTIINTVLSDTHGGAKNTTITIEGSNGKITILLEEQAYPGRMLRLLVDRHEELN